MRAVICGLALLFGAMLVIVLNLFDGEGAQILGAALTLAAVMVGIGLILDRMSRRLAVREVRQGREIRARKLATTRRP